MLEIKHVTKYYTKSKPIISDMNLSFPSKGLNIIVGKSGCGKTTLLNMIGTMDQDYIGSITLDDVELSNLNYNKITDYRNYDSAYIFQINSLFEHLTVKQNLDLVLDLQGKQSGKVEEALEKVGLTGFENRRVKYLSGGERQRVGIARSLVKDSKVILADEPTSALDSKNAHRILALLKEVSKDKLVIVVTHDTKKAFKYADRIIKLVDGTVVEDNLINQVDGDVISFEKKAPRKKLLSPIFWEQFRKNLIINLFIILLCSAVLVVFNLSKEQSKIKDEYDRFYDGQTTEFNALKTLNTHYANEIDFYNVVKATENDNPYTYFQKVSTKNGGLSENNIEDLSVLFKDYNVHYGNSLYGGLIIKDVSVSQKYNESIDGLKRYWNEEKRTNYIYYTYNENNDYNLIYGSLPEEDNEILITDTIAHNYLLNNELDNTDLRILLDSEIIIGDIYHIGPSSLYPDTPYHYTVPKTFVISGIIGTNQLQYFEYDTTGKKYVIRKEIFQQTRKEPYMNTALLTPYGYIVTKDHLDAYKTVKFYDENITMENIYYNNIRLRNNIATFHGKYDYRGIDSYIDNIGIDYWKRLIVKETGKDDITSNEIVVTKSLLAEIYPNIITDNDIKSKFDSIIKGTDVKLSFQSPRGLKEMTFNIIGVAKNDSDTQFYVSEEAYNELDEFVTPDNFPSVTLELKGVSPKERMKIIDKAYNEGYVLIPQYKMPGPYLEFVPTQGEVELVDVEGYVEETNISVYHLFSSIYNNSKMESMNSVLEIIESMYAFTLFLGIVLSLGLIYLKEKRQKMNVMKLSQIGVSSKSMIYMNFISYILIALLIGILSYTLTDIAINIINKNFIIDLTNNNMGLIARFRVLLTNTTVITTIVATVAALIIGLFSSVVIIRKSRR